MKIKEWRQKTNQELKEALKNKTEELRDFMFKLAKGKVKNIKAKKEIRKDIGRLLTILKNIKN